MHIEAEDIAVDISGKAVLGGESVTCAPGRITALVGPSGCGKTTLLHCLGLLQSPSAGRVLIDDVDATGWSAKRRRAHWRTSCAFVLQDYGLMDEESVAFNVTMTATLFRRRATGDMSRLSAALDHVGMTGRDTEPVARLSGGEKQRIAVARAIYKDAAIVLIDEPTASLDAANRERLLGLFRDLAQQGRTLIVATHDDDLIEAADDVHLVGAQHNPVRPSATALRNGATR